MLVRDVAVRLRDNFKDSLLKGLFNANKLYCKIEFFYFNNYQWLFIDVMFDYLRRKIINWLQLDCDRQHIQQLKIQLNLLTEDQIKLINQLEKHMASLDNLTKAITELQSVVDASVAAINAPHPSEDQVQAAADALQVQINRLKAALPAVPVAPVVDPAPAV